jgi:hypothetical protein
METETRRSGRVAARAAAAPPTPPVAPPVKKITARKSSRQIFHLKSTTSKKPKPKVVKKPIPKKVRFLFLKVKQTDTAAVVVMVCYRD